MEEMKMAVERKEYDANLEDVAAAMNLHSDWCISAREIVKITKGDPDMAIYAAHKDDVTLLCKASTGQRFSLRTIRW